LVLVIALVNLVRALDRPLAPSRNELILGCYVFLAAISCFWSYAPSITVVRALELAILYIFMFSAVRQLTPNGLLTALGASLIFMVLTCAGLASVFPWAAGTRIAHQLSDFSWETQARFTWFAVQPINAAAETGVALIFVVALGLYLEGGWQRRFFRVPLWLYLIPLVIVMLATRARGPLLATVIAILALSLRKYVQMRFILWASLLLSLVLIMIVANTGTNLLGAENDLAGSSNPLIKFMLRGQNAGDFFSMTGRSGLWSTIFSLFESRPILGYGYVGSRGVLLNVLPWAGEAHNALAETLLDLGIIGVALVWVPLVSSLFSSLAGKTAELDDWAESFLFATLVFLVFDGFSEAGFVGVVSTMPIVFFSLLLSCGDAIPKQFSPPLSEYDRSYSNQVFAGVVRPNHGNGFVGRVADRGSALPEG
jgi:O-antigen ligase